MKTHKNPSLRNFNAPQPFKPAPSPKPVSSHAKPTAAGAAAKPQEHAKPSKCALEGKKWVVVSFVIIFDEFFSVLVIVLTPYENFYGMHARCKMFLSN